MTGGFVHDVGRRRVFDVMDLAHVARDHQNLVSLKFHERGRRNKAIHGHRAPADLAENVVHLLDARNALKRDPSIEQSLEINFVTVAVFWVKFATVIDRRYSLRRARAMRFAIQTNATIAIVHGARKANATPIMRRLHINAAAPCASVLRNVAHRPVSDETMLPWL